MPSRRWTPAFAGVTGCGVTEIERRSEPRVSIPSFQRGASQQRSWSSWNPVPLRRWTPAFAGVTGCGVTDIERRSEPRVSMSSFQRKLESSAFEALDPSFRWGDGVWDDGDRAAKRAARFNVVIPARSFTTAKLVKLESSAFEALDPSFRWGDGVWGDGDRAAMRAARFKVVIPAKAGIQCLQDAGPQLDQLRCCEAPRWGDGNAR